MLLDSKFKMRLCYSLLNSHAMCTLSQNLSPFHLQISECHGEKKQAQILYYVLLVWLGKNGEIESWPSVPYKETTEHKITKKELIFLGLLSFGENVISFLQF